MTLMPTERLLRIGADDNPLPGESVTYLDGPLHDEDGLRLTASYAATWRSMMRTTKTA